MRKTAVVIMADQSRLDKIATARKKLKKFQLKKASLLNLPKIPDVHETEDKRHENKSDVQSPENLTESLQNGSDSSPSVLKIKQMLKQLNGFSKQEQVNTDDPIITEIGALERRNSDLERNLTSHKRNNEQLGNQVNEQRKQIILLQEQIKKERTELANRQLLEQRSLKEQLEVHIQTIGILVSEKTDLQTTLAQIQKKLKVKDGESSELTERVQKQRHQSAENERVIAMQKSKIEKFAEENNELRKDRDRVQTINYTLSREKEDLTQQVSEIKNKLQRKMDECLILERSRDENTRKLSEKQDLIEQLTNNSSTSAVHELTSVLKLENAELQDQLQKQTESLQRLAADKGQTIERHNQEIEQYEFKVQKLVEMNKQLEKQTIEWDEMKDDYEKIIIELRRTIDELKDEEASQQSEATKLAALEIQKLAEEKEKLSFFLQQQSDLNDKLNGEISTGEAKYAQLEKMMVELSRESEDKRELLDSIQSDKETISKALSQNKELKEQLHQLETRFIEMSNDNMELTSLLDTEKHSNENMRQQLRNISLELEEGQSQLSQSHLDLDNVKKNLHEQIELNEKQREYEAEKHLTDILHEELKSARTTIDQLSYQNNELKQQMNSEKRIQLLQHENMNPLGIVTDSENASQMPDLVLKTGDVRCESEPNVKPGTSDDENSWTSEDSEPAIFPRKTFKDREDLVDSMSASIRQLEMERDQLRDELNGIAKRTEAEINHLQQHMALQIHQEVQQRQRDLLEQVHEQLQEQQQQINALQMLVQKQKLQIENQDVALDELNLENSLPYELLKPAFSKLQKRFLKLMDEKAELLEKVNELEHVCQQLSAETETIGEYISLYQMQRTALKKYYHEREKLITTLSNERSQMQAKIAQLQSLVFQKIHTGSNTIEEKVTAQTLSNQVDLDLEQRALESKKTASLNGPIHSDKVPSDSSLGLNEVNLEEFCEKDSTTQQILQIFNQLNVSDEETPACWFSPAAPQPQFTPFFLHCRSKVVDL